MPISVYFKVIDSKGDVATREVYIPTATTAADAAAFAASLFPLIDPLITGGIVAGGVNLELDVSGLNGTAVSGSDLQEMARFSFRDVANFLTSITLPTFLESKMLSNSNQVNTADADVAAFVTAMTTGIAGVAPTSLHEDSLASLSGAVEAWGNSRA